MQPASILVLAMASISSAQSYGSVYYYSKSGCTGTQDGEGIFNTPNLCQSLDTILPSVKSVSMITVSENCTAHFYTDSACTQGDTIAPIGHCEEASKPFVALNVKCPY